MFLLVAGLVLFILGIMTGGSPCPWKSGRFWGFDSWYVLANHAPNSQGSRNGGIRRGLSHSSLRMGGLPRRERIFCYSSVQRCSRLWNELYLLSRRRDFVRRFKHHLANSQVFLSIVIVWSNRLQRLHICTAPGGRHGKLSVLCLAQLVSVFGEEWSFWELCGVRVPILK